MSPRSASALLSLPLHCIQLSQTPSRIVSAPPYDTESLPLDTCTVSTLGLSSLQAFALTNPTGSARLPFISLLSPASTVPTPEDVHSSTCLTPG